MNIKFFQNGIDLSTLSVAEWSTNMQIDIMMSKMLALALLTTILILSSLFRKKDVLYQSSSYSFIFSIFRNIWI